MISPVGSFYVSGYVCLGSCRRSYGLTLTWRGECNLKKQSHRTPGYSYRNFAVEGLEDSEKATMKKLEVHGDGALGIPVRTATPDDALRLGDERKPSPLA